MKKEIIKFENFKSLSKNELDLAVNSILETIPQGQELEIYTAIHKLKYVIELLEGSVLKDRAKALMGGSTNEMINNCKVSLAMIKEWDFSEVEAVKKAEERKAKVMIDLKAAKEKAKATGEAKQLDTKLQMRVQIL